MKRAVYRSDAGKGAAWVTATRIALLTAARTLAITQPIGCNHAWPGQCSLPDAKAWLSIIAESRGSYGEA
jgi:hypothetical protein